MDIMLLNRIVVRFARENKLSYDDALFQLTGQTVK